VFTFASAGADPASDMFHIDDRRRPGGVETSLLPVTSE